MAAETAPNLTMQPAILVRSSKGDGAYVVKYIDDVPSWCSCPGYRHRKTCRHIHIAAQVLPENNNDGYQF